MKALYRFVQQRAAYLENGSLINSESWRNEKRVTKCLDLMSKYVRRDGALLDIGSRNNLLSEFVACNYVGIDMVGKPTVKCNVEDGISFRDRSFDFIFAGEVIEHVIDTDFFLDECFRVLKEGGLLLLTTPNLGSAYNRYRLLFGKQPLSCETRLRAGMDSGHLRCYTYSELRTQLEEHNFQIAIKFLGDCIQGVRPLKLQMWLGSVFKTFSLHLIFLCQKGSSNAAAG